MAKKTAKKAAAKKVKKQKPATVKSILAECEDAVEKGLGRKRLGPEARKYWTTIYTASIKAKLERDGDTWEADKRTVLHVARKLGKVAAVLTDGDVVELWAAEQAAQAAKRDPFCRAPGSGGYCETIPSA